MTMFDTHGVLRVAARVAIAGVVTLDAVRSASADDAGIHGFLSAIFNGGTVKSQAAPASVAPSAGEIVELPRSIRSRPLTVRLHRPSPKYVVSRDVPGKSAKVSIFEDRTLRRGDAVMTADGIRIFAGSSSWPYAPQDFVSLNDAGRLSRDTSKVLAALDRAPRG